MTPKERQAAALKSLLVAIKSSGLSNRKYAETVLVRDERTLRRWLAEESPIPQSVMKFLGG